MSARGANIEAAAIVLLRTLAVGHEDPQGANVRHELEAMDSLERALGAGLSLEAQHELECRLRQQDLFG